jgi:hypothetical protein
MSTQFWLNDILQLINPDNLNFFNNSGNERNIKLLNSVSMITIIVGLFFLFKTKKKIFISLIILVLSVIIFIKVFFVSPSSFTNPGCQSVSKFEEFTPISERPINSKLSNSYDTGVVLVRDINGNNPSGLNNALYVNQALNFNKGDIIALSVNGSILETCIVNDVQYTNDSNTPVIMLLNPLKNNYSKQVTKILKVSNSSPSIVVPPDPNNSIEQAGGGSGDPNKMAVANFPKYTLPNLNRNDWNLELATYGPSRPPEYEHQGQPFGPLKCRQSSLNNPMGTINVTEYDAAPSMYGTCNVQENNNNEKMTTNQEATLSQRVDDLLFHKGNSQAQFSPVAIDTLPNDQEAFAHFCYRNPTNLVNPKYASIFVNEPDKFMMVSKLARATGTENGGGGGR